MHQELPLYIPGVKKKVKGAAAVASPKRIRILLLSSHSASMLKATESAKPMAAGRCVPNYPALGFPSNGARDGKREKKSDLFYFSTRIYTQIFFETTFFFFFSPILFRERGD